MQAVRTPRAPTIARGLAVRTEATATGKATGKAKAKAKAWCPARSESVGALALAAVVALSPIALPLPALAGGSSVVSEFKTSGVVFKDSVQVLQLKDPEVQGVTIYYTDYTRSITEKLTSKEDAFSDPSQSSIACTASPSAAFTAGDPSTVSGKEGKEIFAELKALNPFQNKQTRIRRIYNPDTNDVVYVAYNTRNTRSADEGGVSSSRYRTSMCSVHISN